MKKYSIYNVDCFECIKSVPDNCVDLILTDPPYNISKYSSGNIHLSGRKPLNNDIAEWDKIEINPEKLVKDFKRILKPNGNIFIFTGYNTFGKWHQAFDKEFDSINFFVWHKPDPPPKIYKNGFLNSCELIICMWNKGHKWNFKGQDVMHNFMDCNICRYPERLKKPHHPTQKPIELLKHLIEIASDENDFVFDPFMGVGSTGVASLELNRKFAGCEINKEYFDATEERFKLIK